MRKKIPMELMHFMESMELYSFKKDRNNTMIASYKPNIIKWIGLNFTVLKDCVRIVPSVGVHFSEIERFIAELQYTPQKSTIEPTHSWQSSRVDEGIACIDLQFNSTKSERMQNLAHTLNDCENSFLNIFPTPGSCFLEIEKKCVSGSSYVKTAAAIKFMDGDFSEAISLVERWVSHFNKPETRDIYRSLEYFGNRMREKVVASN